MTKRQQYTTDDNHTQVPKLPCSLCIEAAAKKTKGSSQNMPYEENTLMLNSLLT